MTLHERDKNRALEGLLLITQGRERWHHVEQSLCCLRTRDLPTVERRCCDEPSSFWSEVWVRAWKVALRVSVSPMLWERVIGFWNKIHVSLRLRLQPSLINSQQASSLFLASSDVSCSPILNHIKHLYFRNVWRISVDAFKCNICGPCSLKSEHVIEYEEIMKCIILWG